MEQRTDARQRILGSQSQRSRQRIPATAILMTYGMFLWAMEAFTNVESIETTIDLVQRVETSNRIRS
ncbi:MAG: hypothetical protein MZU97_05880 [Bacillus subtilis]|nr:hypothetical protein [Bacillus subtilis]